MQDSRSNEDAITLFLSFCIEQYKHAENITGAEALDVLDRSGALEYLEKHYEVIHTQSPQWIVQEIYEYVKNHS
jgi:hypothetical protein